MRFVHDSFLLRVEVRESRLSVHITFCLIFTYFTLFKSLKASTLFEEAVSNIRTVRAFANEDTECQKYKEYLSASQNLNAKLGYGIAAFQVFFYVRDLNVEFIFFAFFYCEESIVILSILVMMCVCVYLFSFKKMLLTHDLFIYFLGRHEYFFKCISFGHTVFGLSFNIYE